ncbi:hypothetical protein, partial [Pseudomaricurvus sp.]|uniref:hypothetical protein n=1 Tax=Pseudomaricurvus sp. TaxID=2004510 RepID=UPI003F6D3306
MDGLSSLNKQSILFVINSLEGGGAEKVLVNLLEHIRPEVGRTNSKVGLYLLDEYEQKHEVPDYVSVTTGAAQGSIGKSIAQLLKEVKCRRPDVIVSFLTRSNCASVLVGKLTGTKVIINERVNTSSHFNQGL